MILKSFGCSFISGTDLATPQHTWPALIAKKYNCIYQCFASPGSGNLQIIEQILHHTAYKQPCFYVIGWSWIDRFDYASIGNDQWSTLMPMDTTENAEFYYRNLHSQYRDKLTTLMYIRMAIDALNARNIPFIMTYMDELIFERPWHTSRAVTDLQDYVRPYLTTFDNKNFLEWSRVFNYKISNANHPLEDAHKAAADYILQNASGALQGL